MQREIKFRAWQSQEKKMYIQGDTVDENRKVFWDIWENSSHISEPMQFTGLQDKNGNDIYEGDKFSTGENDGSYYLIEWDNELSGFCVNLYSYAMCHNEGGGEEFDSNITMVDKNIIGVIDLIDDEIIGNIYESPELLI